MSSNVIFTIVKKYDFVLNNKSLYDLYFPIIGNDATNLYINLYNFSEKALSSGIRVQDLSSLINASHMTLESFHETRSMLEAFGLISTYLDASEDKYYFELHEPLTFTKFVDNQKYRHLLIKNIGQVSYEGLEYVYNNNHFPKHVINVSSLFDQVIKDEQVKSIYKFNFEQLFNNIIKNTHQTVKINDDVKKLIEFYFSTYNMNINEIESCVYKSVIKTSDGVFVVDHDLLTANLLEYRKQMNNINIFNQVKINRNSKLFFDRLSSEETKQIFDSYCGLNSEQYLNAIKKTPLTSEEKATITELRAKYKLDDKVINLMIDFSLLKTHGKLNRKYMCKMAQTINNLNLFDLSNLAAYLSKQKDSNEQPINLVKSTKKSENTQISFEDLKF